MSHLIVHGGVPLHGRVRPSANKNAVLPVLCATLMAGEPVQLHGVPDITDVRKLLDFFASIGSRIERDGARGSVRLDHREAWFDPRSHRLPDAMRSSVLLVPGLLARFGSVWIAGDVQGCSLGVREIDPHVEVFECFGAHVARDAQAVRVRANGALRGTRHWFDYASVTTTENFLLCAVLARGESELTNAACEPHVQELCEVLRRMGAHIEGCGTSRLRVMGVERLGGASYTFAEDFHEIATFLALGAITGGEVAVKNAAPEQFPLLDRSFAKLGAELVHEEGWTRLAPGTALRVREPFTPNLLPKIEAAPWPYVPVDLLPIFIALGVRAEGSMLFWNKVYDGALGWTSELSKFGAQVFAADPHRVVTFGGRPLAPAQVESPYIIRVAIALLMVAASIPGRSVIHHAAPIRRAHPRFVENLRELGAQVEWAGG